MHRGDDEVVGLLILRKQPQFSVDEDGVAQAHNGFTLAMIPAFAIRVSSTVSAMSRRAT